MLQEEGISQQKLSFVPFAQTAKLTDLNVSAYEMKIRAWKIFDEVKLIELVEDLKFWFARCVYSSLYRIHEKTLGFLGVRLFFF